MQDLLNEQTLDSVDINVTLEVCNLLLALESSLDAANLEQAKLAVEMLTDVLQGNTSGKNAESLLDTKLIEMCNRLLAKPLTVALEDHLAIREDEFAELQFNLFTLLHALLDAKEGPALLRFNEALDLKALALLASRWHDAARSGRGQSNDDPERLLTPAFLAYTLLRRITDLHESSSSDAVYAVMSGETRAHFERYLGRVELRDEKNVLKRVYFRVPNHALLLPTKTKDDLLWSVDRDTPGMAIQEFLLAAKDLHVEVVWQDILSRVQAFQLLVRNEIYIEYASIVLAVIQNAILVLDSSIMPVVEAMNAEDALPIIPITPEQPGRMLASRKTGGTFLGNGAYAEWDKPVPALWLDVYDVLRPTLGTIQIVTCGVTLLVHFVRATFLKLLKKQAAKRGAQKGGIRGTLRLLTRPLSHPLFFARCLLVLTRVTFTDIVFLRKLFFFIGAILGVTAVETFFVIHLFQLVAANKGLIDVLRAVTVNGRQLVLTLIFMLIVVWSYAVWGYEMNLMGYDGGTPFLDSTCTSLGQCWLSILSALSSGGMTTILPSPKPASYSKIAEYLNLYFFHFSFFAVVEIVLMNVVFGVRRHSFKSMCSQWRCL